MVPGYIPRSEGNIPLFFQGTNILGTVVYREPRENSGQKKMVQAKTGQKKGFFTQKSIGQPLSWIWKGGRGLICLGKDRCTRAILDVAAD